MPHEMPPRRRWWIVAMKVTVLAAVCVAVSGTFRHGLDKLSEHPWEMHVGWLVAAGLLYIGGMVPMAWFWWRTLLAFGQQATWPAALRAYFFGHLGKYVPGKALVLVIRVGALRPGVTSIRLGVASVLLETLTMMAVGAALAAMISLFTVGADSRLAWFALLVAVGAGVPTLPPVARRFASKAAAEIRTMNETQALGSDSNGAAPAEAVRRGMTYRLVAAGWLAGLLCWVLLGLSLWATLRGIGVVNVSPLADLPLMILVVALAVVAGFVSMLPGGLGVRDALLMQLLSPLCGDADALVAAILVRFLWLLSELGICAILEVVARSRHKSPAL